MCGQQKTAFFVFRYCLFNNFVNSKNKHQNNASMAVDRSIAFSRSQMRMRSTSKTHPKAFIQRGQPRSVNS